MHPLHRCARVHAPQSLDQRDDFFFRNQVCLREQDAVGESDLLLGLVVFVELQRCVLRIDHRDDRVEQVGLADRLVDEERLCDRCRVCETGGLDDHAFEGQLAVLLLEFTKDADQVATHGAADAAVVHLDDLLFRVLQQDLVVDAHLAELVLDHGDTPAMLLFQDPVEQRRLAAAKVAGKDGDRNLRPCPGTGFGHGKPLMVDSIRWMRVGWNAHAASGRQARGLQGPSPARVAR